VKKISFKNIFKRSESDRKTRSGKVISLILLILIIAMGAYLGYPLLFPKKAAVSTVVKETTPSSTSIINVSEVKNEPVVKEKTKFDMEVEQREQGYENKIFTYKPYMAPSNRNPFEKISNYYATGENVGEESEEGGQKIAIRFEKPELPADTKLSGIMSSSDKRIAIIEMEGETYIAKLYDILSDRYIIKEIKKDEVVIDFNGYFFSLKVGGENL